MSQSELLQFAEKTFTELINTLRAKNQDYTQGVDAFKNFRLIEHYGVGSVEQGMFSRLSDKVSRLASFIASGKLLVSDESVQDTLTDAIGYLVIFKAYLHEKKQLETNKNGWPGFEDPRCINTPLKVPDESVTLQGIPLTFTELNIVVGTEPPKPWNWKDPVSDQINKMVIDWNNKKGL